MLSNRNVVPLMLPMLVGLTVFAFVPESTAAQCGWCRDWRGWSFWSIEHEFPNGSDLCGIRGQQERCSRCGTGLGCHNYPDSGPCHILCGPAGEPTALRDAVDEVKRALEVGDAVLAAAVVQRDHADLIVECEAEAGRINFKLPCNPMAPAATVAVLPGARSDFEAALTMGAMASLHRHRPDRTLVTS